MRQMMEQRLQETLGATDTEWKVLGPRVMKVAELSRQAAGGGRGMMMFGRGRGGPGGPGGAPGRRGPGGENRELTQVEKAQQELQTTLDNTAATPDAIKKQLTLLRAAREKAKQELAKAQQDVRQVLTLRQEATMVLMGMLD
jgi:flagellar motility protein MotE (MotC chaperone)